jgi:hypothetical protein
MSTNVVKIEIKAKVNKASSEWDILIERTKEELKATKRRAYQLAKSVAFFEKKRDAKEPWPGKK